MQRSVCIAEFRMILAVGAAMGQYFCYVRFALDDRGAAHLDGCSLAGMAARHLGPSWWAQRAAAEHGPR